LLKLCRGISEQEVQDVIEKICGECMFGITDFNLLLENNGEVLIESKEITLHIINSAQDKEELMNMLSNIDTMLLLFKSYLESHPLEIVIDINNEFEFYGEEFDDSFKEQLRKTIKNYEILLEQQSAIGEDVTFIKRFLRTLKAQLHSYEGKTEVVNRSNSKKLLTFQEQYDKALKEIFHFYANQRFHNVNPKNFDITMEEQNKMLLGYFSKLLKDFEIDLEAHVN